MSDLLVEKYRPDNIENYVFTDEFTKEKIMGWIDNKDNKRIPIPNLLLSGSPGTGKAQPLNSKVLTPTGFVPMGDITVGTTVVTPNGKTANVIGVYPQGIKDVYSITLSDGRVVESCGEHLWEVYRSSWKSSPNRKRVLSLTEIMNLREASNHRPIKIDIVSSFDFDKKELPVVPYVMGYLLGNGNFTGDCVKVTIPNDYIKSVISSNIDGYKLNHIDNDDYRIVSDKSKEPFIKIIENMGLRNHKSFMKFIPDDYMNSSTEDRIELIRGLIDSDGTVDKSGSISYCSTSKKLAENVQYVIRSLGGLASISDKKTNFTYNGVKKSGLDSYNVNVRIKNPNLYVSHPEKSKRIPENYQYNDTLKLTIKDISFSRKCDTQCIMLDSEEHLYITDDFTITHNTTLAKILVKECGVDKSDVLYINASRQNNVDTVRTRIHDFCSTMAYGDYKVVILDEGDMISEAGQKILRAEIEAYHATVRFIVTCNYKRKIIEALKSRFEEFDFERMDMSEYYNRLVHILTTESIEYDAENLIKIVERRYPDLRKGINEVAKFTVNQVLTPYETTDENSGDIFLEAMRLFKNRDYIAARKYVCSTISEQDYETFYRFMYDNLDMFSEDVDVQFQCIVEIAEGMKEHRAASDVEINLAATFARINGIIKGN